MLGALIPAAIGAASSFLGSRSSKKAAKNQQNLSIWQQQQAQENSDFWNQVGIDFAKDQQGEAVRQFNRMQHHAIADRVNDARQAGVHPLFALGGGLNTGGVSAGTFGANQPAQIPIPGRGDSGSALGTALSAASGFLSRREERAAAKRAQTRQERRDNAQVKLAEARVRTEELEQQRLASELRRAEQKAMTARTFPLPDIPPSEWKKLKTKVNPPEAHAETVQVYDRTTGERYDVPNPDVYEEPWSPATLGAAYHYGRKYARKIGNTIQWAAGARKSRPKWR